MAPVMRAVESDKLLLSELVVSQRGDYRKEYESAYDETSLFECSSFLERKRVFLTLAQKWNDM